MEMETSESRAVKKLKAIITGGKDQYGIWMESIPGIYGAGDTLEATKDNLAEAIQIYMEIRSDIPEELKGEYEIEYTFDTSGFLKYYSKYISFAAMKEITGIAQKQLWDYANGYRHPKKETSEKIVKSICSFGESVSQTSLYI
ncbi:hypothetical protein Barb6XT_01135 [Bacteroidales bacterium Barb6XT]|nr:hypothetical protein Barb6XT_01135 [Bacteroidales bacterium Barb6XT]